MVLRVTGEVQVIRMLQEVSVRRPSLAVTRSWGDSDVVGVQPAQAQRPPFALTLSSRGAGSGSGAVEEPSKPEPARLWAQRMCDLIGRCWDTEPAVRPTFECIVQELKRAERELIMGDRFCSAGYSNGAEGEGGSRWGSAPSKGLRTS